MKKISSLRIMLLIIVALTVVGAASAQKPRRTPKPLATPLPTLSGAEIISQAGDYQEPVTTVPIQKPAEKTTTSSRLRTLSDRVDKLETSKKKADPDDKQRRMLLNLDILTRAEQRSESLRKQLFDLIEKENNIKTRLDQIDIDSRPEVIERALQLAGSMKPEEVRDARRRSLEAERNNLQNLLTQIQNAKAGLTVSLDKADLMVEKLRVKLEKEIDDSFLKDDEPIDEQF